jgi:hypothetical protein
VDMAVDDYHLNPRIVFSREFFHLFVHCNRFLTPFRVRGDSESIR